MFLQIVIVLFFADGTHACDSEGGNVKADGHTLAGAAWQRVTAPA